MVPGLVVLLNFSTDVLIYFSREEEAKDRGDYREEENEWPRQFPAWLIKSSQAVTLLCTFVRAGHDSLLPCPATI